MELIEFVDLIRTRIEEDEKLSLTDIAAIKACVNELGNYLKQNETISKENAKEIITFVDFTKRIAIRAYIFTNIIDEALHKQDQLTSLIDGYKNGLLREILLGDYLMENLENKGVNKNELTIKAAMNVVIKDYIYAKEIFYSIVKTHAYTAITDDLIRYANKERYDIYSKETLKTFMEIRDHFVRHRIFDHALIDNCLQKMQGLMQKTYGSVMDTMDLIEIIEMYSTSTSEMFGFSPYTKNFASMDYMITGLKELIDSV